MARKIQNFKKRLKDPDKKQRSEVTKFIAKTNPGREFFYAVQLILLLFKIFRSSLIFFFWSTLNLTFTLHCLSRQEFIPPFGKFVNLIKPDPLHSINNGWKQWFTNCLTQILIN